VPTAEIHPLQIPHHSLSAAPANLLVQSLEVRTVPTPNVAYRQRSVSSLESPCWYHPSGLREHHYMQTVRDFAQDAEEGLRAEEAVDALERAATCFDDAISACEEALHG
jgi:hypothetical protein